MARKVTDEDIQHMLELYSQIGTYAGVAREIGYSASTVRKYIVEAMNQKPPEVKEENKFDWNKVQRVAITKAFFQGGNFLCLSKEEKREIEELWKEMRS